MDTKWRETKPEFDNPLWEQAMAQPQAKGKGEIIGIQMVLGIDQGAREAIAFTFDTTPDAITDLQARAFFHASFNRSIKTALEAKRMKDTVRRIRKWLTGR